MSLFYLQLGFKETHWLRGVEESRSHVLHEQLTTDSVLHKPASAGETSACHYQNLNFFLQYSYRMQYVPISRWHLFWMCCPCSFKSLLLSHHSTCALVSEILESVLQTVQKQLTYRQYHYIHTDLYRQCAIYTYIHHWMCNLMTIKNTIPTLQIDFPCCKFQWNITYFPTASLT